MGKFIDREFKAKFHQSLPPLQVFSAFLGDSLVFSLGIWIGLILVSIAPAPQFHKLQI